MSSAAPVIAARNCADVQPGKACFTSAAIAAACGAAADVPKNGLKSGAEVDTPSAAVMSGLLSTTPPVAVKLPAGAPGSRLPAESKKTRRGPSELKNSTTVAVVNGDGYGPTGLCG